MVVVRRHGDGHETTWMESYWNRKGGQSPPYDENMQKNCKNTKVMAWIKLVVLCGKTPVSALVLVFLIWGYFPVELNIVEQ